MLVNFFSKCAIRILGWPVNRPNKELPDDIFII